MSEKSQALILVSLQILLARSKHPTGPWQGGKKDRAQIDELIDELGKEAMKIVAKGKK